MSPPDNAVRIVSTDEIVFTARVRKDYRITIPEAEHRAFGVQVGDYVSVRMRKVLTPPEVFP